MQLAAEEAFKSGMGSLSDTLVDAANGADVSWSKFFDNFMVDMEKAILKAAILQSIGSTGAGGGVPSGILGMIAGGANGFDAMVPGGRGPFLPGFAGGGDMLVGGGGATDAKVAMFRVTPGESIHVRTPAQQNAAAQGGQSHGPVVIQNVFDRRALLPALSSPEGKQAILNVIRENPGMVRSLINQ